MLRHFGIVSVSNTLMIELVPRDKQAAISAIEVVKIGRR
jgi:hypothetical protein